MRRKPVAERARKTKNLKRSGAHEKTKWSKKSRRQPEDRGNKLVNKANYHLGYSWPCS